jgi:hypothetical protein
MLNYDHQIGGIIRSVVRGYALRISSQRQSPGKVGIKRGEKWLDSSGRMVGGVFK